MMEYQFRPVDRWPGDPTPPSKRRSRHTFQAKWRSTLELLDEELRFLKARQVVIQADVTEDDIRLDGMLRANARVNSPRIILSFESIHGPLSYPCDSCELWQHNIRSIALALRALRAVDRYGVTRRSEQYQGWKRIPQSTELTEFDSVLSARLFIEDIVGRVEWKEPYQSNAIRRAKSKAHPDSGGNARQFKLVCAAEARILKGGA